MTPVKSNGKSGSFLFGRQMAIANGELGFWRATSLVVGNIVGTGIFMLPASLAAFGTLGLFGWVLTSIGSICLALTFARLSARFPKTGGPYAYSREAFGDFVGFQMAWSYWTGTWAGNAAIATAFVSYLTVFWPQLAHEKLLAFGVGCAAIWFFTILNSISMRSSGIAQMIIVVLKVAPLCLIGLFGVFFIRIENFLPINPTESSVFHVVASASALTLFAFLGLESATIPADNVINPQKTIPRATILGTVISAVIYIWTTIVLMGVVSSKELALSHAPFSDASAVIFGQWTSPLIALCALISAFGTLNGWIVIQGQMPYAAAKDGLFPSIFAQLSRFKTPVFSLVASSFLMCGVLYLNYNESLVNQFTAVVTLTTFAVLIPYLYSTIADLKFLLIDSESFSKLALLRSVFVTLLGFSYTIFIIIGSGQEAVFLGILFLFLGFPLYALMKRLHPSLTDKDTSS